MLGANVGTDLHTALERLHLIVEVVPVQVLRAGFEQTLGVRELITPKVLVRAQLEFVLRLTDVEVSVLVEPAAVVAWHLSISVGVARLFR